MAKYAKGVAGKLGKGERAEGTKQGSAQGAELMDTGWDVKLGLINDHFLRQGSGKRVLFWKCLRGPGQGHRGHISQ